MNILAEFFADSWKVGIVICVIAYMFNNILLWEIYAKNIRKREYLDLSFFVYIPNANASLTLLGGIVFIAGLSMILGGSIRYFNQEENSIVTNASYALSIGLALITLYTLALHKEDRHKRGNEIESFTDLVRKLTTEVDALIYQLDSEHRKVAEILFFTNNPYFGLVSANKDSTHPDRDVTRAYYQAMKDLGGSVESAKSNGVVFKVIYGDDDALSYYHSKFGEKRIADHGGETVVYRPSPDEVSKPVEVVCKNSESYVKEINELTVNFVESLKSHCPSLIVHRAPILPRRQYVVINQRVFEFMIQAGVEAETDQSSKVIDHRKTVRLIREDFNHWFAWLSARTEGTDKHDQP